VPRFAFALVVVIGMLAVAPTLTATDALACMRANHPSGKIAAIDAALPTTTVAATKLAEAKDLRQKAYDLTMAGKLAEAHQAANGALKILGVEWKAERQGPPTRC